MFRLIKWNKLAEVIDVRAFQFVARVLIGLVINHNVHHDVNVSPMTFVDQVNQVLLSAKI